VVFASLRISWPVYLCCALVEGRFRLLAEIFGVGVYAFALMANHVHLVVVVLPDLIRQLSDEEIVKRWLQLYPSRSEEHVEERRAEMLADPARLIELRNRLGSLSWFIKCLNEHIARTATKEDDAKGHFWEGRLPVTCEARHARHCRARQTRPSDVPQAPRGLVAARFEPISAGQFRPRGQAFLRGVGFARALSFL